MTAPVVTDTTAVTAPEAGAAGAQHLKLLPRPQPGPEVMAAIAAAAQLVWPQPSAPDEQDPVHQTWRFSGRWWNRPTPLRRDRPWARG